MEKRIHYLFVIFRNLIIFSVIFVIAFMCIEKFLSHKNKIPDNLQEIETEDFRTILMNMEWTKISPASKISLKKHFNLPDSKLNQMKNEIGYPLSEMYCDDIYDTDDAVNIVIIGDSFVWGAGCTNRNELFWNVLELSLRKQGYKCNVFGVGIAGASSVVELSWLKETNLVKELQPDIVIIGYVYNDAEDLEAVQSKEFRSFNYPLADNALFNSVFPNISDSLANYIRAKTMYNEKYGSSYYDGITTLSDDVFAEYEKEFLQPLDEFAESSDFPVILMTLPGEPNKMFYPAHYAPFYDNMGNYSNVCFYDCHQYLCSNYSGRRHQKNYHVNFANRHPGPAVNKCYAEYIEKFLKKDFGDILGEPVMQYNEPFRINEYLPNKISFETVQITENELIYSLTYPEKNKNTKIYNQYTNSYLLNYPIGEDYIKLSFECPVDIESVEITADSEVSGIDLYYTRYNEKLGYDDRCYSLFGKTEESSFVWTDTEKTKVSSFCISVDSESSEEVGLQIKIQKAQ